MNCVVAVSGQRARLRMNGTPCVRIGSMISVREMTESTNHPVWNSGAVDTAQRANASARTRPELASCGRT